MSASHDALRNSWRAILSFFLPAFSSLLRFFDRENSSRTVRLFLRRVETGGISRLARLRVLRVDAASRSKNWMIKRCPSVKWRGHYHKYLVPVGRHSHKFQSLSKRKVFLHCDIFLHDSIDTVEDSGDEFWLIWNVLWYWDGDWCKDAIKIHLWLFGRNWVVNL